MNNKKIRYQIHGIKYISNYRGITNIKEQLYENCFTKPEMNEWFKMMKEDGYQEIQVNDLVSGKQTIWVLTSNNEWVKEN